jgi:phosphoribosyl-AMP cyclohydrolase
LKTRKLVNIDDLDFDKAGGLVPVVVQDSETLKVLTLAYANREAVEKTIETGYAHFFRRSFGRVMKKGEKFGNVQEVKEILVDCDRDAVLYLVKPSGPACHLGKETCFHNKLKEEQRKQVL